MWVRRRGKEREDLKARIVLKAAGRKGGSEEGGFPNLKLSPHLPHVGLSPHWPPWCPQGLSQGFTTSPQGSGEDLSTDGVLQEKPGFLLLTCQLLQVLQQQFMQILRPCLSEVGPRCWSLEGTEAKAECFSREVTLSLVTGGAPRISSVASFSPHPLPFSLPHLGSQSSLQTGAPARNALYCG